MPFPASLRDPAPYSRLRATCCPSNPHQQTFSRTPLRALPTATFTGASRGQRRGLLLQEGAGLTNHRHHRGRAQSRGSRRPWRRTGRLDRRGPRGARSPSARRPLPTAFCDREPLPWPHELMFCCLSISCHMPTRYTNSRGHSSSSLASRSIPAFLPGSACGRRRPTFYRQVGASAGGSDGRRVALARCGWSVAVHWRWRGPLERPQERIIGHGLACSSHWRPSGARGGVLRLTRIKSRLILNDYDRIFRASPDLTNHNRQPSH